jgi:hypothetical protein
MTHFLWVEDFKASENKNAPPMMDNPADNIVISTIDSVFGNILDIKTLNDNCEDIYDVRDFLKEKGIFLKFNLLEALDFIRNPSELSKIDFVVLDVDMPLSRDGQKDVSACLPSLIKEYGESELSRIAGYPLYIELVIELGFPKSHILFCSNHAKYFSDLHKKFESANIKQPISPNSDKPFLEKDDKADINQWLNNAHLDYFVLRRGIIEGCKHIANLIKNEEKDEGSYKGKEKQLTEDYLHFNKYIEKSEKEVSLDDMRDYLQVLENFLPLRDPDGDKEEKDKKQALYKLFIRTLAHEWDVAEPQLINKADKKTGQYAFAWIMKMTRNWMAHGKVFEQLTAQDVAYLFIVNMRAMFDLSSDLLPYEKHLLSLFEPITADEMKDKIGNSLKKDETNPRKIPLAKKYALLLNRYKHFEAINFHDALNGLQKQKQNYDEKDDKEKNDFLIKGLFQTFWFLTSSGYVYIPSDKDKNIAIDKVYDDLKYQFKYFDYHKDSKDYLFELARHIYNRSFS